MGRVQPLPLEKLMKIGNPDGKGPLTPVGPVRPQPEAGKAEGKAPNADPSTTVELSEAAAKLLAEGGAASQFDAAKVARIAQSISDGTYKINAEVIADKLIANAQELLGKASR
jgi:negative regulator of flagellin synthesis FlgM